MAQPFDAAADSSDAAISLQNPATLRHHYRYLKLLESCNPSHLEPLFFIVIVAMA